jgi:hypothetical protein
MMVRRRTGLLSPSNATASTPVIEAVGVEMLDLLFTSAVEMPDLLAGTEYGRHICKNQLTPAFPKTDCLCVELITWGSPAITSYRDGYCLS